MTLNRRSLLAAGLTGTLSGAGLTGWLMQPRAPGPRRVPALPSGVKPGARPLKWRE